jgi:hypothetical protein
MTTLDLPWYGNNQARCQAEVLNFLQQNSDAVAKEWAEIVLHFSSRWTRG